MWQMAEDAAQAATNTGWEPSEVIALVGVIVAPIATIIGVIVAQAWEGHRAVKRIQAEQTARGEDRGYNALVRERDALHSLQETSQRVWKETQEALAEIMDRTRGEGYMAFAKEMTGWHHAVNRVAHSGVRELGKAVDDRLTALNEIYIGVGWGVPAADRTAFHEAAQPDLVALGSELTELDNTVGARLSEIFGLETKYLD